MYSGLSAGTFHPFCVVCPDPVLRAFRIWGNIWLLIASLITLWIWTLTLFIISSISLDFLEFNSLDSRLIPALELALVEFWPRPALSLDPAHLGFKHEFSSLFSKRLLFAFSGLLARLLSTLSSISQSVFHLTLCLGFLYLRASLVFLIFLPFSVF